MENSKLYAKYPHILNLFNSGFEDGILSVQEDGCGIFVAYVTLYGVNIIFTQDDQGFIGLSVVSDKRLTQIIHYYEELEQEYNSDYE